MATVKESPPSEPLTDSRSLILAAFAIGLCMLVELFVLTTRTRFGEMFREFELELPVISAVAISWVLPTLLAAVILVAITKEFIPTIRRVADRLNGAVLLVGTVCLAVYVAGVFMPLFSLMIGLS